MHSRTTIQTIINGGFNNQVVFWRQWDEDKNIYESDSFLVMRKETS